MNRSEWRKEVYKAMRKGDLDRLRELHLSNIYKQKINVKKN